MSSRSGSCGMMHGAQAVARIAGVDLCQPCIDRVSAIAADDGKPVRAEMLERRPRPGRGAVVISCICPCGTKFRYRRSGGKPRKWCNPCRAMRFQSRSNRPRRAAA